MTNREAGNEVRAAETEPREGEGPVGSAHAPEWFCGSCGAPEQSIECWQCGGEGVTGHDCGEDSCCCARPADNVPCDVCGGAGYWWVCPKGCAYPAIEESP